MKLLYVFFLLYPATLAQDVPKVVTQGRLIQGPFCFRERPGVDHNVPTTNETSSCVERKNSDVLFYLFTRQNRRQPEFLHLSGGRLSPNTYFNPKYKTKFIIHGYLDAPCRSVHYREMKDQLLCRGNYNVILVDYTMYNFPDPLNAFDAVGRVANATACVIRNLISQKNVSKDDIHLIAHSLGSHVAGGVGKRVPDLARITGLDPAGIGYGPGTHREHLGKTDAKLVDVIHTSGTRGYCLPSMVNLDPMGHIDIYVNGGTFQPSCIPYLFIALLKLDIVYVLFSLVPQGCAHMQVLQYYKNSINACKCQYVAVECDSYEDYQSGKCKKECNEDGSNCIVMGLDLQEFYYPKDGVPRKYYVDTIMPCPYCDNSKIQLNDYFYKANPTYKPHCCWKSSDGLPSPLNLGII